MAAGDERSAVRRGSPRRGSVSSPAARCGSTTSRRRSHSRAPDVRGGRRRRDRRAAARRSSPRPTGGAARLVPMQDALERALAHARRAGDERLEANVAVQFGFAAIIGPLPVDDGRRSIARTVEHMTRGHVREGDAAADRARFLAAMAGDFDEARRAGGAGHGDPRLARPQRRPRCDQDVDERDRPARRRRRGRGAGASRRARHSSSRPDSSRTSSPWRRSSRRRCVAEGRFEEAASSPR